MIYNASVEAKRLMSSYSITKLYTRLKQEFLHNHNDTLGIATELLFVGRHQSVQPLEALGLADRRVLR